MALPTQFSIGNLATWLASSIIPADRQLVAARRPDGTVQAKFGNGSSLFGALPELYVDPAQVATATSVLDVKAAPYNATGDGVANDTAAIQAAVTYAVTNGATLSFGSNPYKITASIDIPAGVGFKIIGENASITQATNNTPIFRFLKEDTRDFEISGFRFLWTNLQSAANKAAVAIGFDPDSHAGHGIYNFRVRKCTFDKGYAGLGILQANSVSNPIWGARVEDCVGGVSLSGPVVWLDQSAGAPRISIFNVYARRDTARIAAVYITNAGVNIDGLELNNCTDQQLYLSDCTHVLINHVRVETCTMATAGTPVFAFPNIAGHVEINSAQFQSITWNTGATNALNCLISAPSGVGTISVNGIHVASTTITSGTCYAISAPGVNFASFNRLSVAGTLFTQTYAPDGTGTKILQRDNQFARGIGIGENIIALAANGAVTFDARLGSFQRVNLAANATSSSVTNLVSQQLITLEWIQDSTGGRAYVWPTNCVFSGLAPTQLSQPNARTAVTFRYDATNLVEIARTAPARAEYTPDKHGLLTWSQDLITTSGASAIATAGTLYLVRLTLPVTSTVTNIVIYVQGAGSSLTAGQCFAGLFTAAGVLIASTADQATAWASSGNKIMALAGGPYTSQGAGDYYVGVFFNGTTGPSLLRGGSSSTNQYTIGLSTPNYRVCSANTGLTTAMPGTLGTQTSTLFPFWAALS